MSSKNEVIHLKDYKKSPYKVLSTYLKFEIEDEYVLVTNSMKIQALNEQSLEELVLNGEELDLQYIEYNGENLKDYTYQDDLLRIKPKDSNFTLVIQNKIFPHKNLKLMGLYNSGDIICTQCEAEGFRRITFFLDRPDVLSKFTTEINANIKKYPYLLSNGNLIKKTLDGERQTCIWEDPFYKPAYLFALVAGDLDKVEDKFTTKSGREVKLEIFVDKGKTNLTPHAMNSLKQSMKWDEDRFRLEYDLDIYMIVAVDSFNMGAMENKGLNVFNSKYVLGNSETATDKDYYDIQAVIGHEYFHNWTGNRVTCRDWFQLTLKEGLTVFRDREFSSDLNSRSVKRIDDVSSLRSRQFTEDAGPFSHPIKPKSYSEINNFYTMTIYEKGAEVIGMIHTLIGEDKFQKGIDKYFELYDGTAATTENFLFAMQEASGYSLEKFSKWYDVYGTPTVEVSVSPGSVQIKQIVECPEVDTLEIPLRFKLLNSDSFELVGNDSEVIKRDHDHLLILRDQSVEIKTQLKENPLLSFNRNFSAPVILKRNWENESLKDLLLNDDDPFSLWDYGQIFFQNVLISKYHKENSDIDELVEVCSNILENPSLDDHFKSSFLRFPSVSVINESLEKYDFQSVSKIREDLISQIGKALKERLLSTYQSLISRNKNIWNNEMMGVRALQNTCLSYLSYTEYRDKLISEQTLNSPNMTNVISGLELANKFSISNVDKLNAFFESKCLEYDQLYPTWFAAQANNKNNLIENIKKLSNHKSFKSKIPNYLYRLYGQVLGNHLDLVYEKDSPLMKFLLSKLKEIDSYNPQVASRFFQLLKNPEKFSDDLKDSYKKELSGIYSSGLSKDSSEVVGKFLGK